MANKIFTDFPSAEVSEASPGLVSIRDDLGRIEMFYGPQVSRIQTIISEDGQSEFAQYVDRFFNLICDCFEIETLTRAGFRTIYHVDVDSEESAKDVFRKFAAKFGVQSSPPWQSPLPQKVPDFSAEALRISYKNEKIGLTVNSSCGKTGLKITGPFMRTIQSSLPAERDVVNIDLDYYTNALVSSSFIVPSEFARSAKKLFENQILSLM